ncbi:MAG: methyltransferase domain-containing protein [Phycisphaerales bacterium]
MSTSVSTSDARDRLTKARKALLVALPEDSSRLDQDEEYFVYSDDGGDSWQSLRVHDYAETYDVPGLYDRVVYDIFKCTSPEIVGDLLADAVRARGDDPASMRVLDFGAGNGAVAEALRERGFARFVGADLLPEAAAAADRDRPGLYDAYAVGDITNLPEPEREKLTGRPFDALICVAALGFGDIPPDAFAEALSHVRQGGYVAFTIKSAFLDDDDSDFSASIRGLRDSGALELIADRRYVHRVNAAGEKLEYTAMVGVKADRAGS